MVTKGLHFNDVSLVVVLQADMLINKPDFRSTEQAFQMLEQVAGRAGRAGQQGEVMIQTFDPKNPIFDFLQSHDYQQLYSKEIIERKAFLFPPYCRQLMIMLRHRNCSQVEYCAALLQKRLQESFGKRISRVITPIVARRNNQHVRQLRLSIETTANIHRAKTMLHQHIHAVLQIATCKGTNIVVDVDP
jgi:primosomal protein N' (replication factor Y)